MSLLIKIFAKFMDKFHFRNKILILLLIISLLLLVPFSVVFYLQGRQIEKNIQKQAELKLNILSHSFLHFQNLLNSYNSIITTNNKLKQDLYFYQKTGTYEKNKFEESIIPIYKTLQVDILNLYDSNSRVMLRSHQSVFFDIIKDRYLEETSNTKKYQVVIKRHTNPKTSETSMVVMAYSPVLFNDKLVGVCAIGYHLETLIHRLKNLVGEELILSHKGEFLASSIKNAVEYEVNVEESIEKAINSGYIKARNRSNNSNVNYDASYLPFKTISKSLANSQKPLIVSSDVQDLGIYLLVDNHILKSNLKRLELINYIIIGSILIIVVIIAFLFAETIKKPIHEVVSGFNSLAGKDLSTQLQITSNDEMGDLSKSFNILALELKTHIESLDSLVKERTRELEEKNQEIMKSIYYAKNIQTSILPPKNKLSDKFKEHFVIWKPKDEVGGDFYFFKEMEDDFLVGVVDCTGHGVPGAFMAMAASSTLDRITDHIKNPAEILKELNISIRRTLNQNDPSDSSRIDDG
ncbi:MAG: HAMP domain-containing protein, partial [Spirochaetota bacterium]|nr:HAMP domain-containing protein [Spirochaetota bacterium]